VKQAPKWNEVVKVFAKDSAVIFADVNLASGGPRGSGQPGQGGWPTIRYYNKKTGKEGAGYVQKTTQPVCSELGPDGGDNLFLFIEEAGSTSRPKADL